MNNYFELPIEAPLIPIMFYNEENHPWIPNIPVPVSTLHCLKHVAVEIANKSAVYADMNPVRMHFYNVISRNNWNNDEYVLVFACTVAKLAAKHMQMHGSTMYMLIEETFRIVAQYYAAFFILHDHQALLKINPSTRLQVDNTIKTHAKIFESVKQINMKIKNGMDINNYMVLPFTDRQGIDNPFTHDSPSEQKVIKGNNANTVNAAPANNNMHYSPPYNMNQMQNNQQQHQFIQGNYNNMYNQPNQNMQGQPGYYQGNPNQQFNNMPNQQFQQNPGNMTMGYQQQNNILPAGLFFGPNGSIIDQAGNMYGVDQSGRFFLLNQNMMQNNMMQNNMMHQRNNFQQGNQWQNNRGAMNNTSFFINNQNNNNQMSSDPFGPDMRWSGIADSGQDFPQETNAPTVQSMPNTDRTTRSTPSKPFPDFDMGNTMQENQQEENVQYMSAIEEFFKPVADLSLEGGNDMDRNQHTIHVVSDSIEIQPRTEIVELSKATLEFIQQPGIPEPVEDKEPELVDINLNHDSILESDIQSLLLSTKVKQIEFRKKSNCKKPMRTFGYIANPIPVSKNDLGQSVVKEFSNLKEANNLEQLANNLIAIVNKAKAMNIEGSEDLANRQRDILDVTTTLNSRFTDQVNVFIGNNLRMDTNISDFAGDIIELRELVESKGPKYKEAFDKMEIMMLSSVMVDLESDLYKDMIEGLGLPDNVSTVILPTIVSVTHINAYNKVLGIRYSDELRKVSRDHSPILYDTLMSCEKHKQERDINTLEDYFVTNDGIVYRYYLSLVTPGDIYVKRIV